MRLNSKWNRRSFLGSVGVIASSIFWRHENCFAANRASADSARGLAAWDNRAIHTKSSASRP